MSLPMAEQGRRHEIDFLRVASFGLLILFHTSLLYGTRSWHLNSDDPNRVVDLIAVASHPWRMSLLFFISGIVTASLFERRSAGEIRSARSRQLLPPFIFGVLFIVPPQIYVGQYDSFWERMTYWEFWTYYIHGGIQFEHLWFLLYLWFYTLVWSLMHRFGPHVPDKLSASLAGTLRGRWLLLLPVLYLTAARTTLYPAFGETLDFMHDYCAHAVYLPMFLAGALLAGHASFWQEIDRCKWRCALISLFSGTLLAAVVLTLPRDQWPPEMLIAMRMIRSMFQWCTLLTILAFARRLITRPNPVVAYLNRAVLTYYVLHQTFIVLLAYLLKHSGLLQLWSSIPVLLATCLLCAMSYELKRFLSALANRLHRSSGLADQPS
ncbi:hypothetical protein CO670_29790 [Rhizobium sp. J15]|nr:hypothetical protein CO670_29790 [Rhizobium sp. J15]